MSVAREPWPEECEAFLVALREGMNPHDAAIKATDHERGGPLTSMSFRRWARHRLEFAQAFADAQAERREKMAGYVGDKLVENVERAMQAVPVLDSDGKETGVWTYQGSVANRSLELIGKTVGMFGESVQVELTGAGGGPLEIEDRSASLADVARVLEAAGALSALQLGGVAGAEVADTRELLPAASDG